VFGGGRDGPGPLGSGGPVDVGNWGGGLARGGWGSSALTPCCCGGTVFRGGAQLTEWMETFRPPPGPSPLSPFRRLPPNLGSGGRKRDLWALGPPPPPLAWPGGMGPGSTSGTAAARAVNEPSTLPTGPAQGKGLGFGGDFT